MGMFLFLLGWRHCLQLDVGQRRLRLQPVPHAGAMFGAPFLTVFGLGAALWYRTWFEVAIVPLVSTADPALLARAELAARRTLANCLLAFLLGAGWAILLRAWWDARTWWVWPW